ncbi:MAG: MauE/DoxX family redox-associated membrane protein [Solirubrobacteraceae bacterium]
MGGRRVILLVPAAAGAVAVAFLVVGAVPGFGFLARVLLAGVFLVAGVAKLRDRKSFADTLEGFGTRGSLVPALAVLLPALECAVAGLLLVPATSSAGALGALALLLSFSVAVGVALARGRTADCGCFGKDRTGPLSVQTLVRNGVLAGFAGAIAVAGPGGGDPVFGRLPSLTSLAALGLAAVVAVGLLAARRRGPADEPNVSVAVPSAGQAIEPALTRRRWMRVAGATGLAGALGSWLGWPEVAGACAQLELYEGCGDCHCLQSAPPPRCCLRWVCNNSCFGFAGGGVVRTASGSAQASFFGNKLHRKGSREKTFGGTLVWFDPAWKETGLSLQSTRITSYGRVPGSKLRELKGLASANGSGKHKFVLRVLDAGKPGSGADTVSLHVSGIAASGAGGASGEYTANGHLAQGDLTVNLQATVQQV